MSHGSHRLPSNFCDDGDVGNCDVTISGCGYGGSGDRDCTGDNGGGGGGMTCQS